MRIEGKFSNSMRSTMTMRVWCQRYPIYDERCSRQAATVAVVLLSCCKKGRAAMQTTASRINEDLSADFPLKKNVCVCLNFFHLVVSVRLVPRCVYQYAYTPSMQTHTHSVTHGAWCHTRIVRVCTFSSKWRSTRLRVVAASSIQNYNNTMCELLWLYKNT